MHSSRAALLLLPVLIHLTSSVASAGDLFVPGDYPTINDALAAAVDGDVIHVSPGTYPENIVIDELAVTLRSTDGPEMTVIDGQGAGPVVRFIRGDGLEQVVEGFTLTNGTGNKPDLHTFGGAIDSWRSAPVIRHNIITGNQASYGGGVYIAGGASATTVIEDRATERSRPAG